MIKKRNGQGQRKNKMTNIDLNDLVRFVTIKKGLAPSSIKAVKLRTNFIFKWLSVRNKTLTKDSVEELLLWLKNDLHLKNNSINTYVFCLRYIKAYYDDRGIKGLDFFENLKSLPKNKGYHEVLSWEEILKLISTHLKYGLLRGQNTQFMDKVYINFTTFLALTGSRFEESASLVVKYVDLPNKKVIFTNTKNGEIHHVFIKEPVISVLKEQIEGKGPDEYVFTNAYKNKFRPVTYSWDLRRRAKAAGIVKKIHPHMLRRSFASILANKNVKLDYISQLLNHKDIQTTYANYAIYADEPLRKASGTHPVTQLYEMPEEVLKNFVEYIADFPFNKEKFTTEQFIEDGHFNFDVKIKRPGI